MANELALIESNLAPMRGTFQELLPASMPVARFMGTALQAFRNTPYLLQVVERGGMQSAINSALTAAVLGLEIDGVTGQAAIVPFKGKCQLLPMTGGYITLAGNGGYSLEGVIVRQNDEFELRPAEAVPVHHVIKHRSDKARGEIDGVYGVAKHRSMPATVSWIDIDTVLSIRNRSAGYQQRPDASPWKTDFPAMVIKTGARARGKRLPLRVTQMAAALDTQHDLGKHAWITPGEGIVVDGAVTDVTAAGAEPEDALIKTVGQIVEYHLQPSTGPVRAFQNPDIWAGQIQSWVSRMSRDQLQVFTDLNDDHIAAAESLGAVAQANAVKSAIVARRASF